MQGHALSSQWQYIQSPWLIINMSSIGGLGIYSVKDKISCTSVISPLSQVINSQLPQSFLPLCFPNTCFRQTSPKEQLQPVGARFGCGITLTFHSICGPRIKPFVNEAVYTCQMLFNNLKVRGTATTPFILGGGRFAFAFLPSRRELRKQISFCFLQYLIALR